MYYYDVHVKIPKNGYSVGVKSEVELSDDEAIELAKNQNKFEENSDVDYVDYVDELTKEEFENSFNHA
jgi:hypothetical protein